MFVLFKVIYRLVIETHSEVFNYILKPQRITILNYATKIALNLIWTQNPRQHNLRVKYVMRKIKENQSMLMMRGHMKVTPLKHLDCVDPPNNSSYKNPSSWYIKLISVLEGGF